MKKVLLMLAFLYFAHGSNAATITSSANGFWHNSATWVGGVVPLATDDVVIKHRVDINTTTGNVTANSILIFNDVSDAELEIFDGRTLTVTNNLTLTADNYNGNNTFLLLDSGTVNITGNLVAERTLANTFTINARVRLLKGSQLSCANFTWNNRGTGNATGNEIELNNGKITVSGNASITHQSAGDFDWVMTDGIFDVTGSLTTTLSGATSDDLLFTLNDSSVIKTGTSWTHNTTDGDDFNLNVRDSSRIEIGSTLDITFSNALTITETIDWDFRNKSYLSVTGLATINHLRGDDFIFDFIDDTKAEFNGGLTINKSGGTLGDNSIFTARNNADIDIIGNLILNKDHGDELTFRAYDDATVDVTGMVHLDVDGGGNFPTTFELNGSAIVNVLGNFIADNHTASLGEVEIELNGTSPQLNISGNLTITNAVNTARSFFDLNAGTLKVDGATGVTIVTSAADAEELFEITDANLNITAGNLVATHTAAGQNFRLRASNSTVTVDGFMTLTNNGGATSTLDIDNNGILDIQGGDLTVTTSATSSNDLVIDFDDADIDIVGKMIVNHAGADDVTLSITNTTVDQTGDMELSVAGGDDFTANINGTSVLNAPGFSYIATGGDATTINISNTADVNITNNFTLSGTATTGNFTNNFQDKATIDVGGNMSFTRIAGGNYVISLQDTTQLSVAGDISLIDNYTIAAGSMRLDLARDVKAIAANTFLTSITSGNDVELELNNTASYTTNDITITAAADGDALLDINGNSNLYIAGSVVRNSDRGILAMEQQATIHFNGTTAQVIPSRDPGAVGGDLFNYTNMELNNTAGFSVGANGFEITDTLTFTQGVVTNTLGNMITFFSNRAWATGASNTSYINGPARKFDDGALTFPLGNGGDLGLFSISDGGNNQDFTVEYFKATPNDTNLRAPGINNISSREYWQVTKAAGAAITVTPQWDDAYLSGITDLNDLFVVHFTGGQWVSEGNGGVTGAVLHNPGTIISANSISTFSPITFGSASPKVNPLGPGLMETVQNGNWHNPATWDINMVPTATDYPIIWHDVTVQADSNAVAASLEVYNDMANAALDIQSGASVVIGSYLQAQIGAATNNIDIDANDATLTVGDNLLLTRTAANSNTARMRLRARNSSVLSCDTLQVNAMGGGSTTNEIQIESNSSMTVNNDLVMLSHMNADNRITVALLDGSMTVAGKARNSLSGVNGNDITYVLNGTGAFSVGDSFIANQQGADDFSFTSTGTRTNTFIGPVVLNISGGDESTFTIGGTSTNVFSDNFIINQTGGDNTTVNFTDSSTNTLSFLGITNAGGDNVAVNFRQNSITNINTNIEVTHAGGDNVNIFSDEFADVNVTSDVLLTKTGGLDFAIFVRDTSTMDIGGGINIQNNGGAQDARVGTFQEGKLTVTSDIVMTNDGGKDNEIETNNTSVLTINGNLDMNVDAAGENLLIDLNGASELIINGAAGLTWNILAGSASSSITGNNGSKLTVANNVDINHNGTQDFTWANNGSTVDIGNNLDYGSSAGGDDATFTFNNGANIKVGNDLILLADGLGDDLVFTCDSCDLEVTRNMTVTGINGTDATTTRFTGGATVDILGNLTVNKSSGSSASQLDLTGDAQGGAIVNVGGNIAVNNNTSNGNLLMNITGLASDYSKSANVTVSGNVNVNSSSNAFITRLIMQEGGTLTAANLSLDYNSTGSNIEMQMDNSSMAVISGNLTLDATAAGEVFLDMNDVSELSIGGAVIRPSNFGALLSEQGATIRYNGTTAQTLAAYDLGAGDLFEHANVITNNAAGFNTTDGDVRITDTLKFRQGMVNTTAANKIVFSGNRAFADSATHTKHINGPSSKIGAGEFRFPSGKNGWLGMISISDPGNSGDFTAEYYYKATPVDTGSREPTLNNVSNVEWWDLNRNSGTASAFVTLWWEHSDTSYISNVGDLRVAHYNGTIWEDKGQSVGSNYIMAKGFVTTNALQTSFSPFTFGSGLSSVNPLPVKLAQFEAIKLNENEALVKWTTTTEINNNYFEVERSVDGKKFISVGTVKGNNNANNTNKYAFIDQGLAELGVSKVFYRLKQVDYDGKTDYSDVRSINLFEGNQEVVVQAISPNPFNAKIAITINNIEELSQPLEVKLFNTSGQEVLSKSETILAGLNELELNVNELPAGIYILQVINNGRVSNHKIIKE